MHQPCSAPALTAQVNCAVSTLILHCAFWILHDVLLFVCVLVLSSLHNGYALSPCCA